MTTVAQIKRLVRPLLQRHDDLALLGRWVILKPVRHVARGIVIDSTGEAARFRPFWSVVDICEPRQRFPLNWGEMFGPPKQKLWYWSDPSIQEALIEALENKVLPLLRSIQTLDDFVSFASGDRFYPGQFSSFLLSKLPVDVARGDLDSARAVCAKLATGRTLWSRPDLRDWFDQIVNPLCPLLQDDDRTGMLRLLREWEAFTVKTLGLQSVWEKTSFPLELPPGEDART